MPQATAISFSKFLTSVQSAVKAVAAQHPKFQVEAPNGISVSYLIRGFPVPDTVLANVSLAEAQAFANDVAAQLATAVPGVVAQAATGAAPEGAVVSVGRHVIIGIPPVTQAMQIER